MADQGRDGEIEFSVVSSSGRRTTTSLAVPQVGDRVWHDRPYVFSSLGYFASGKHLVYVKASNDDKTCAANRAMWTLDVPCAVTVYLDFWGGQRHEQINAAWLTSTSSGWQLTDLCGVAFSPNHGPGRVYKQTFPPGRMEIPGKGPCPHGAVLAFLQYGEVPPMAPWRYAPSTEFAVHASSGRRTTVEHTLPRVGDTVWYDRQFTFTSLGGFAGKELVFVKASNDDKTCAANRAMWTLHMPCSVTVYLDFWGGEQHERINASWLKSPSSGWELTVLEGVAFTPRYGPGRVYTQTFDAGRIEIQGKGTCAHGAVLAFLEPAAFVISLEAQREQELLVATSMAGRTEELVLAEVASQPLAAVLEAFAARFGVPVQCFRVIVQGELVPEAQWERCVHELVLSQVAPVPAHDNDRRI